MLPSINEIEPWLAGLAEIPQNPVNHGEGDVLTHTHMVMDSLARLPAYTALPEEDRQLLTFAAVLHDIGKKTTTRLEDGQWKSPHHGKVGAVLARELLMTQFGMGATEASLRQRETICALVRLHMKPLYVLKSTEPERTVRQMAAVQELTASFTLEKLALLAEADNRGRICGDMRERQEDIDLFRLLAQEQGVYRNAFPYPDPCSRYADFSGKSFAPGEPVYNNTWGTVIMLSGLPGTGKDTYIRTHYADFPMLSLDEIRLSLGIEPTQNQGSVAQAAQRKARECLRARQPFVFNATNVSPMVRQKWINLFHQYHAAVHIVYLETAWTERMRRNASRHSAVPEADVLHMLHHLEPPTLDEAEEVEWVCVERKAMI